MDPELIKQENTFKKATEKAVPIKDIKSLLPHELDLLEKNHLSNIIHSGSSSIWLETLSTTPGHNQVNVYRPMGDIEALYLLENNQLANTQLYQAIMESSAGRNYANKYLTGQKYTDTNPTTIVEFTTLVELIETLKKIQIKVKDGTLSMGLGPKAGMDSDCLTKVFRRERQLSELLKLKEISEK